MNIFYEAKYLEQLFYWIDTDTKNNFDWIYEIQQQKKYEI